MIFTHIVNYCLLITNTLIVTRVHQFGVFSFDMFLGFTLVSLFVLWLIGRLVK